MRKAQIAIGIVAALAAFAAADFYLNNLGREVNLDSRGSETVNVGPATEPVVIPSQFKIGNEMEGYRVMSQAMTGQIFDKVDLGAVKKIRVVKTRMEKALPPVLAPVVTETAPIGSEEKAQGAPGLKASDSEPLTLYEILGPRSQGALTYLAVKLQFVAQINATTETINEDGKYGDNSFFYNDQNLQSFAFLVVQSGDNLYGFQYNKKGSATYESVQRMVQSLTQKP